jgi:arylsulfatase A
MKFRISVTTLQIGLAGSTILLPLCQGCGIRGNEAVKPLNIVFILSDDQGWNQVGYHGITDYYETPNIDRIAREGMYFTNAYSASPVCSPTRASIMTGKNPARLHLTDYIPGGLYPHARLTRDPMEPYLPLAEKLLPQYLKEAGYVTGHFGKWHLSPDRNFDEPGRFFDPQYRGFDDVLVNAKPSPGHDPFDDPHHVEAITRASLKFLDDNKDNPFFLYVSHHIVHTPLIERDYLVQKYRDKPGSEKALNHPVMGAMIERMDDGIGRILDKLEELGLAGNTVVIFFSDNGGLELHQSQDPLRGGKAMLFEGGIRVPFCIRWPGVIEPGRISTVPVISDDFLPTLLEIAGQNADIYGLDGKSLVPLFREAGDLERDALYWHYPHYHHLGYRPSGAVRMGDFKLIEWYEPSLWGEPDQISLYNLREDIGETRDLSREMSHLAVEMRERLHRWRRSVNAQEMQRNPGYREN